MSLLVAGLSSLVAVGSSVASDLGITAASTSDQTSATQAVSTSSANLSKSSTTASVTLTPLSTSKTTKSSANSTSSPNSSTITSSSSPSASSSQSTDSTSNLSVSSSTSKSSSFSSVTTPTSAPANPITSPTSTALPTSSTDGNDVSTVGIAVAAVFAALILAGIAFLLWKYLPVARRYRDRKYEERSHRKGLSLDDEEGMHLDDPQQGLALRKFSFHTAPTYYPGQPHEPDDISKRPLTSASEDHIVSPLSVRSMGSLSQHTLPSALKPGSISYTPYREVRASQIGMAVPIRTPNPGHKGLPPLPSVGYGREFN